MSKHTFEVTIDAEYQTTAQEDLLKLLLDTDLKWELRHIPDDEPRD